MSDTQGHVGGSIERTLAGDAELEILPVLREAWARTEGIKAITGRGHVNLVETMAEDIAAMCLEDPRVRSVRVRVEKLDILENAESVGVEIERFNSRA